MIPKSPTSEAPASRRSPRDLDVGTAASRGLAEQRAQPAERTPRRPQESAGFLPESGPQWTPARPRHKGPPLNNCTIPWAAALVSTVAIDRSKSWRASPRDRGSPTKKGCYTLVRASTLPRSAEAVTASKAREVAVRAATAIGRGFAVRHAANWAVGPLAAINPGASDWLRHHVPVRGEVPVVSNVDGRPFRLWAGDDPDWLTVKLARNGFDIYEPETMRGISCPGCRFGSDYRRRRSHRGL